MTQSAIVEKLKELLVKGIVREADALYLIVEVRKLLEQQQAKKQYEYLTFHCDWAVHPTLAGSTAQKILERFDAANIHLKTGVKLCDLPKMLRIEIDRISKMSYFEDQLETFLRSNGLPTLDKTRDEGWIHFVHLYARIVEDCPLVMTTKNRAATIESVTLKMDLARATEKGSGDMLFKVRWIIQDKNGKSGEIFILNSFSLDAQGKHADDAIVSQA